MSNALQIDKDVFELHNQVRTQPTSFIYQLENYMKLFDEEQKIYIKRDGRATTKTSEGVAAVEEAIEFLKKCKAVRPLTWSSLLGKAAKKHVEDAGAKGSMSHNGSDGKSSKDRMKSFGNIIRCYGENMAFNCIDAEEIMI